MALVATSGNPTASDVRERRGSPLPEVERTYAVSDLAEILATQHKLGDKDVIKRRLRYFTSERLLDTVGAVHTGSGRRRLYSQSAMLKAVVLIRLFQMGATVGLMKEYMEALQEFTLRVFNTKDLLVACRGLEKPTIFLILPDLRYKIGVAGRLMEWKYAVASIRPNIDFIAIQIYRFL
jgi:DNA-binding transcriptional MerR regulator